MRTHDALPAPPAELDFGAWLTARTPAGAPVVTVMPPGARSPLHLPRLREAALAPPSLLGRRRRGSAPAVHAAYQADIEGKSPRQIASSGLFPFSTERSARQHIRDGRLTAADLGAWPWAVVEGKTLPRNWWADRDFALALTEWAVATGATVRRLRPRLGGGSPRLPVA